MKTIELLEALNTAAQNQNHPLCFFELPVKYGKRRGNIPLLQITDLLVKEGGISENSVIGVSFDGEGEDWFPLHALKKDGEVRGI